MRRYLALVIFGLGVALTIHHAQLVHDGYVGTSDVPAGYRLRVTSEWHSAFTRLYPTAPIEGSE